MPVVFCPHCNMKQVIDRDLLGEDVDCPGCNVDFTAELEDDREPVRRRTSRKTQPNLLKTVVVWSLLGTGVLAALGIFLSQFAPVFGGFLENNLARPFSPARLRLIPIHLFAFGLVGGLIGAAIPILRDYASRR